MKLYSTLRFNEREFQTLNRVEPCVRVAFPTDHVDRLEIGSSDYKRAWREYKGRHLLGVCSRQDQFPPWWIHAAYNEACALAKVLAEQSVRQYWEVELAASFEAVLDAKRARGEPPNEAVGLIAPGTDVCGLLAETRKAMLRDAQDAIALLEDAREAVGPAYHDEEEE